MKFTDGNWMIRKGFTVMGAVQPHEIELDPEGLTAYAAPRPLQGRGSMLDTMLLTVRFFSPLPGVIGIRLMHHMGEVERGPAFSLFSVPGNDHLSVEETDGVAILRSGGVSVRISSGEEWRVDFFENNRRLTGSASKSMAYIRDANDTAYVREELELDIGECLYGLGERFTPFVKNGQTVDIWNADGGTSTEQAYKNIPFYISSKGYGVLVNHPGRVSFELASEKVKKAQFSVPGETMEYYILAGPTMKDVLGRYTELTGKPALPPAWSFGLWLSTSFTTQYDEETVTSFVDGMKDRDIPLHVFHFDCFWMKEFHWTDFRWDRRVFPDPAGMLARLKEKGLKICVWINPYIAQRSPLFAEGKEKGYLLRRANGDVWQGDQWQPGMGLLDFTNPEACSWYAGYLKDLVEMGVDAFKTDFGERIPVDVAYADGSDPVLMHNYYTFLYNRTVFNVLEELLGPGEAAVFARSATVGCQQFPVHWGGDCYADYGAMAESLRGGLSLGLSGFGFWSHDIGGFENTAPAHVFKRWLAFGLLSSHSRLHGSHSYRVPWAYDEESVDTARFFTKLKCSLMPYLYDAAAQAHEEGLPVMRAMVLEFLDDPACLYLDRQYMLGGSLLVAPVFSEQGDVDYYLPRGRWTRLLTGETEEGGRWIRENHGFLSLPLWVRPNSFVAVGAVDHRPDYTYAEDADLRLYALEESQRAKVQVRDTKGVVALTVSAEREQQALRIRYEGTGAPFRISLYSMGAVAAVEGSGVEAGPDAQSVSIPAGALAGEITIRLE